MFDFLATALAFFYDLWPSYGGSIALFTLAIMLVLSPLSIKSTRSMIRMQRLQPEMKRLQAQYKGDREALNREMMALYQANNVNPFSSCLPLFLQMPVFFVLYRVLSKLTQRGSDGTFEPSYISKDSALFKALDKAEEMMSFGIDLSKSALTELREDGFVPAIPFFVMIALVAGTAWYQQRQIAGRNPNAAANPQQQMVTKLIPFIFIPITLSIPAGVVIYFVVSNLVRIGQQALVTKLEFAEGKPGATVVTPPPSTPVPKKAAGSGGGTNRAATGRTTTPATARNRNTKKKKRK